MQGYNFEESAADSNSTHQMINAPRQMMLDEMDQQHSDELAQKC